MSSSSKPKPRLRDMLRGPGKTIFRGPMTWTPASMFGTGNLRLGGGRGPISPAEAFGRRSAKQTQEEVLVITPPRDTRSGGDEGAAKDDEDPGGGAPAR